MEREFGVETEWKKVMDIASKFNQIQILTYLIEKEILVDEMYLKNILDKHPDLIFLCCSEGHVNSVKKIISIDNNIIARKHNGLSTISVAAQHGHHEVVQLLLKNDAAENKYDGTPLFIASFKGHLDVVRLFLEKGGLVESKTKDDWTPLHIASQNGHLKVVRLLLQKGALVEAKTKYVMTQIHIDMSDCEYRGILAHAVR